MESIVQERIQERNESKIRHSRGENGRRIEERELSCTRKKRSYHKRRRMMPEDSWAEKVRESENEKVAEQLPAKKKRIEANKLSPEANTFSRGKVMVNLSHSKLKRKVIPKRNTCRPQKFHGNKSKLAPEKIASARTQMLLRLWRSIGLC